MSNEDNAKQAIEQAKNAISSFLKLKEDSPKVFYGAIGGVVVVVLFFMMSGGSSTSSHTVLKTLVVGQQYQLKAINSADKNAMVRLVSVPGSIAAYDDTEKDDREGDCKHMPQGVRVSVMDLQDYAGEEDSFARVKFLSGKCEGKDAWTLSVNVQ